MSREHWVKPVLQSLHSWDTDDVPLEDWTPRDPSHFGIRVHAYINTGTGGQSEGVDNFDAVVCSPTWFAEMTASQKKRYIWAPVGDRRDILFGNGLIFMRAWNYALLREAIEEVCADAEAPDWEIAASRIDRLLEWEYAYRYDEEVNEGKR